MPRSTIAAVSSPPGPGDRAVIRVSGPEAGELVRRTARLDAPFDASRRGAYRGRFLDGRGEQPLLLLWMPGPRSYTREDVAELHLSGSPPLVEVALARLLALGARPAAPGEFTRRAFESGRIDLTRAEGVLAVIEASNEAEARAASELLFGGLARRVDHLRDGLAELRALAEASLDFDEADTGHVPEDELMRRAEEVGALLREALTWEERREPLSGMPRVALVGEPNAGKSSLFNALVDGGGRALVSDLAGTTRDGVAGVWCLGEVEARLVDTPGLAGGALGEADRGAQELGRAMLAGADLLLFVVDASSAEAGRVRRARRDLPDRPRLLVWSKMDLLEGSGPPLDEWDEEEGTGVELEEPAAQVAVSARTGLGLDRLAEAAARALGLGDREAARRAGRGLGRELSVRHRHALESSARELDCARDLLRTRAPLDLVAEALRFATDALDDVRGRTTSEDVLDRIFARFCLGK